MICGRCMVVMKSGTTYEQRNGKGSSKRYDECPKCHDKRYNNSPNFQESLIRATQKHNCK